MNRERLKGHLDLLLLSVLDAGPAHGYAIISALRERSEGTFDLPEGTIYPALHRLEDAGLLSSSWAAADGRRRRVYALTREGAAALTAEQRQWQYFARGVQAVLGWPARAMPGWPARAMPGLSARAAPGLSARAAPGLSAQAGLGLSAPVVTGWRAQAGLGWSA